MSTATLVDFPVSPGYSHDLGGRQNLPKECLCFGQTDIVSICISLSEKRPALAKMRSFSVKRSFDKWQTELLIKKDNLHISRKVIVKKRHIQKKKNC